MVWRLQRVAVQVYKVVRENGESKFRTPAGIRL
jgi:hypothetical protein